MGKQTIEIDVPDGYELTGQFTSTEGNKVVGIGYKLKPVKNKLEKLIKKFEKIVLINSGRYGALDNLSEKCAEECKKVACDFAWFMMSGGHDTNKTWDELFGKFIEEKYGQTNK
jgi:hypothetical protein